MTRAKRILLTIAAAAFYIGAVGFFIDNNIEAGLMGTAAGTICLAGLLAAARKKKG